CTREYDTTDYW
nr:immunoglobulin heavy chain junction region [Mus musculus]